MAADLDDPISLVAAFTDVEAIFSVTDFWQFARSQSTHATAAAEGRIWNVVAFDQEFQQGKNVIDAAATVLAKQEKAGGVKLERMVISSLADVAKASGGKYTWSYHFDGKARYVQYLKEKADSAASDGTDLAYKKLCDRTSYLHVGYYLDNWKMNAMLAPNKLADGSFAWGRIVNTNSPPLAADKEHSIPFVHPPVDTGVFVSHLILHSPPRTTMLGTSRLIPFAEYVALWGKTLGVKASVQDVPLEKIIENFPPGFGIETGQSALFVREFGWDGGEGAQTPWDLGVDMTKCMDVERYFKETDWKGVLGQ